MALRDEQIKLAIEKVPGRIQGYDGTRTEPIAIVGYGPSLRETWEQVKVFPYIISCSGSHKFLIERNVIPKWHVEVDPRSHKVALLGTPHAGVTYLPASTCHPAYFDHLLKHQAKIELWHVFDNDREAIRVLPRGEWAITGGCDVGLRAMTIAGFFGFTDLHVFGLDGSAPSASEGRHAGEHPHGKQPGCVTTYEGRDFYTTPAMLEAARMVWHELNQMPDVKATFYGDGLIQHMAKFYQPAPVPKERSMLGFAKPELISTGYLDLQVRLHRDNLAYGVGAGKHGDTIIKLSDKLKTKNILDYGCLPHRAKVETEHGLKGIRWIVTTRFNGKVRSLDETGRFVWRPVVGWSQRPNIDQKPWVSLCTPRIRRRLLCTEDHPCAAILNVFNPRPEYVLAGDMAGKHVVRPIQDVADNRRRENALFNEDQRQALFGMLLGDGYLSKPGCLYVSHGLAQRRYVEFKRALLGGRIRECPPSQTGKSNRPFLFYQGPTNAQTKALRHLVYHSGRKTVENLIDLVDERSLAFWYMDDGRLKMIGGQPYAEFHTEGFSISDCQLLIECLYKRWQFHATAYAVRPGQVFLHLNHKSSQRLFALISSYVIGGMDYKLPPSCRGGTPYPYDMRPLGYSASLVEAVRPVGGICSDLFDIEVADTHNFVANGTVVHNCGKGYLAKAIPWAIDEYDPAIAGKEESPKPADLVVCTDVLEHIEPDKIMLVLDDLRRCVRQMGYFVIHTGPSTKSLADGRNAHILQRDRRWWKTRLSKFFQIAQMFDKPPLVVVIVVPKPAQRSVPKSVAVSAKSEPALETV